MNDANWFAVFMKAYIQKYYGKVPTQKEWDFIVEILKEIPTERLSK
jgi:hypothetical protein